jgi:hypothetical protein
MQLTDPNIAFIKFQSPLSKFRSIFVEVNGRLRRILNQKNQKQL